MAKSVIRTKLMNKIHFFTKYVMGCFLTIGGIRKKLPIPSSTKYKGRRFMLAVIAGEEGHIKEEGFLLIRPSMR